MTTHASYGGYCVRIQRRLGDHELVPHGAKLVAQVARMVRPNGHYDGAPTCTLYHLEGAGYIAAHIRRPHPTT